MHRATPWLCAALTLAACGGPAVDRDETFARLREAMNTEIPPEGEEVLEAHNQLVETVRDEGIFDGMRRFEVQEKLGRGQECGGRALCAERGFPPTAWVYEIGRRDGLPWGPTLIVGFDRQGFVENVFTLTRR